ncbi:MAG TPA: hypothetical protein PKN33_05240 [Phycisphaerae bacterium]|nr:hypothetical protein [Phycisphaerae bacterium]
MNESTQPINDEGLRCPRCEYNLTGLEESVCPECGCAFDRRQLLAEKAGAPAPIPIWGLRNEIGLLPAFARTVLNIWFHPIRFAKRFPINPNQRDATVFSRWCLGIAVAAILIPFMFVFRSYPSVFKRTMIVCVGSLTGVLMCERILIEAVFVSVRYDKNQSKEFVSNFGIIQMTRAYLIMSALWGGLIGLGIALYGSKWNSDTLFMQGATVIAIYWWICMSCIAANYRASLKNMIFAIFMIPLCVALSYVFGMMAVFLIASICVLFNVAIF